MDINTTLWDNAEKDFQNWLIKDDIKENHYLVRLQIIQSIFFTNRSNLHKQINGICNQTFEQIRDLDLFEEEKIALSINIEFDFAYEKSYPTYLDEPEIKFGIHDEKNRLFIKNLLNGDKQSFLELYENDFPKVAKYIIQNSGTLENAKDVFQNSLLILFEKYFYFELDLNCSLSTYLFSIGKNLWYDELRKKKKEEFLKKRNKELLEDIVIIGNDDKPDNFKTINELIELLGERCQELIQRFYYRNQTWQEICDTMGYVNVASAKNQKYKCLEKIRKQVVK